MHSLSTHWTQTNQETESLTLKFVLCIKVITNSLLSLSDFVTEQYQINDVLDGLPKEYNSFAMHIYGKYEPLIVYYVEALIVCSRSSIG